MTSKLARLVGKALKGLRAGDRKLAWNDVALASAPEGIGLASPSFAQGAAIPRRHAGAGVGANLSPALGWKNVPPQAVELVLIVEDPDAPLPSPIAHLIAYGLPPNIDGLPEGALAANADNVALALGRGSFGRRGYAGPRPFVGHGAHRYHFQIFALSEPLAFDSPPDRRALLERMRGKVLSRGRLVGSYER
jgi:Raf kinase inhibitor-like YbhB/YbcL family protein